MLIKLVYLNFSINKEIYLSYSKDFVLKNDELLNNIYIYQNEKKKKTKLKFSSKNLESTIY